MQHHGDLTIDMDYIQAVASNPVRERRQTSYLAIHRYGVAAIRPRVMSRPKSMIDSMMIPSGWPIVYP